MSEFYDNFAFNKKKYKLSNEVIGAAIHKTGDALRMAIKNKSLSVFEVAEVEKLFGMKIPAVITKEFVDDLFGNEYFLEKLQNHQNSKKK